MTPTDYFVAQVECQKSIAAAAPDMAKLWHPTRNGCLKPTDVMPGSNRRLWWRCEKGHEWQASAYSVKSGSACPYCFGRYAIPGETDLATTHPQMLQRWSSRNSLSPTEVTAGSHKKVWWRCSEGHEWEAVIVSVVLEGSGCPYCAGKRAIPGKTDLATLYPDLMEQWDHEKNTIKPAEILPSAHDKVWWKCGLGHGYQAVVFSRTRENGSGCPYCTGKKVLPGFNDLQTLKPKLADQWHSTLNGDLRPTEVSPGSNKKVWWQCGDGHVWQAAVYSRTRARASGCPVCAGTVKAVAALKKSKPRKAKQSAAPSLNA